MADDSDPPPPIAGEAPKSPSLREQLEHINSRQLVVEIPRRSVSGASRSPASFVSAHEQSAGDDREARTRRFSSELSPGRRGSIRSRTLSPTAGRVRFSDELERPDQTARSPTSPSARRNPPSLHLDTGLYTIESNVPDMVGLPRQAAGPGSTAETLSRRDHIEELPRYNRTDSMPESPVSLTRPRQRFEQERTKGPRLTLVETREALAQSRDWVARQRKKQADWAAGPIGRIRSKTAALYESYIIRGLLRQKPLAPSVDGRHIPLEPGLVRRAPLKDGRTGKPYRSNFIRSSRYTVWDFLPKQLFFQFSKLANFYFLIIGILQMVPGLSTTGTYTTIAPLIAFVALSMAKEGYDDYRRYRLDKQENRSSVWVLDTAGATRSRAGQKRGRGLFSGKRTAGAGPDAMTELEAVGTTNQESDMWAKIQWQDVRVGDIVRLRRDDNVPADMVLLSATGPNGVAYIETMALDGETNLKSKQASTLLAKHCGSVAAMSACDAEIVSEDPNLDLYNFEGRATVNGETMPLTMNQVVYRGSTLRNTSEAVGLVINSGEECKIRMNANKDVHAKAPKMQSVVNRIVVLLVFFVILLSVGCTIGYYVWHAHYEVHANYLRGHYVPFKEIFIGFVIEFNTLIPLSLYVSLEIIKLGQLFLLNDIEMYDPVSNTPMVANTTTILENLGQVSYVFSDKTGTLTENLMRFRKMSVAGTAWLHDMDVQREEEKERERKQKRKNVARMRSAAPSRKESGISAPKVSMAQESEPSKEPLMDSHAAARPPLLQSQSTSRWRSTVRPGNAQPEMKTEDLIRYLRQKPHTPFSRKARQFILCLALCHTCLPETDEKGEIKFQAASPDELALVEAAKDLGYLLVDRAAQSLKLQFYDFDGTELVEEYEIMDVIEFSSKRKRMSIVVRMPDGRLCIYTKGADSVILPRLKQHNLAVQTASAIERKASMRKSMEQEKALRRMSAGIQRESISLARAASIVSMTQHKIGASRKSSMRRSISAHRQSSVVTDEVDSWLSRREELDQPAGNNEAYYPPRPSITRQPSTEAIHLAEVGNLVDESLALNEAAVFERCFQHIDDFATEGLRTLIFAYRYLEEDDYNTWKKVYHDATTSLVNRQERIEEAAEMIEQDFDLAGATAIEDKLQQGVPDTIDKLRRANIKVWMLTGDKRETAINIAHSARICKPFSEVYILDATEGNLQEKLASTLLDTSRGMIPHTVVVIDGHTLNVVEEDESLKILFFDLVSRVDSVICCRASPSQKATLVKCIRDRVPGSLTLAIGDGANDIAMIQASHVGIGISGREGLQAARISDYSIAQFRFLQRLLFVHGRWNYIRTGKYILGTFWKEIVFYLVQAQYQRYNGYTGTSLFEPASLTVFNTLFTSLPVILLGIFEKDLQAETLLAVPELYTYGQKDKGFNFGKYLAWMFMAAAEAIIIFNVIYEVYSNALFTIDTSLFAMGACGFTVCVIFINLKMLVLELHHRTIISFLGLFISVSGWFVWNLFLSVIYAMNPGPYLVRNAFLRNFGRNPVWWFTGIAALGAVLTFEIWVKSIRRMFWPSDQQLMQEIEHYKGVMDVLKEHAAERGEAGAAPFAMTPADNSAEGVKKSVDIESIKTVGSSPNSEMAGWAWDPTGGDTSRGRQPATAGKRASRLMAEEYVPPPFTPPAEEKENPMEAAMGASSSGAGSGATQAPAATPSIWVGDMNSGATPDESMLTQSPIELRIPPRRGRSGKNSPGSTS